MVRLLGFINWRSALIEQAALPPGRCVIPLVDSSRGTLFAHLAAWGYDTPKSVTTFEFWEQLLKCSGLGNRDRCLEEAMLFRDTDLIKAITGVRRCGESGLLDLIRMAIESEGVAGRGFVSVNLESKGTGIKTEGQLYDHVRGCLSDKGRTYVFIDEPQRIDGWQDAVNAMRVDFDCDIYLTGSNAYLLSSELATYLSGRFSATISTRSDALSAGYPREL